MSMGNTIHKVEVVTSVQRRRRWSAAEKVRMVEETYEPGITVSEVARRHGVAPNRLFTWGRLASQGALTRAGAQEEVVPASEYRALQAQTRELQRLLGKKTLETEILKEALERTGSKKLLLRSAWPGDGRFPVKAVAETLDVARANLTKQKTARIGGLRRRGRPPVPEGDLLAAIKGVLAAMPSYGYRRVHALPRRQAKAGIRPRTISASTGS